MTRTELDTAVIDELIERETLLRDRIASLEQDIDVYKLICVEAMARIHALAADGRRRDERYHRLLDEYRRLREQILGDMRVAA
jgi:hypothetical protein